MKSSSNNPFADLNWSQLQSQYLDAFNALNDFGKNKSSSKTQWLDALEFWWRSNRPFMPDDQKIFVDHILSQSKTLYFLGDQFQNLVDSMEGLSEKSGKWKKNLESQFEAMKAAMLESSETVMNPFNEAFAENMAPDFDVC